MQPGNQFNMGFGSDQNVAPDSSLPQSAPSIQAQEFENNSFQQNQPGLDNNSFEQSQQGLENNSFQQQNRPGF